MYILTPSGSLDYRATEKYLDYIQGNIKSKIQLVICLDQLIDVQEKSTTLYIHDSAKSLRSSVRDSFVYNIKELVS